MASGRIKGITIEIDGDTTKLTTALKQVDKQIRDIVTHIQGFVDKLNALPEPVKQTIVTIALAGDDSSRFVHLFLV